MVKLSEEQTSRVFRALADPTRRRILKRIARSDVTVADIREPFEISAPAVSKHLKVLERAGLILRVKDGAKRRFRMDTEPLEEAKQVIVELAAYWAGRLDAMEEFLDKQSSQQEPKEEKDSK